MIINFIIFIVMLLVCGAIEYFLQPHLTVLLTNWLVSYGGGSSEENTTEEETWNIEFSSSVSPDSPVCIDGFVSVSIYSEKPDDIVVTRGGWV